MKLSSIYSRNFDQNAKEVDIYSSYKALSKEKDNLSHQLLLLFEGEVEINKRSKQISKVVFDVAK
jgi:hypothetical protein